MAASKSRSHGHDFPAVAEECLFESMRPPMFENPRFRQWATEPGIYRLHLRGSSVQATRHLADLILVHWQRNFRMYDKMWVENTFLFSFNFNSKDSLRSSIAALLPSLQINAWQQHAH
ncbi:hypothetical protein MCOR14_011539 [Pyricularia oryzae]|nr:hypothetical protein MCOR01_005612 [Pyricularia oryzae]KAI6294533.1 hypothetical protein MCOR34_009710 [Pyricularia oryzae]KAI6613846.1 hypothetical protein MCOR14_011539 [Pyricularia oryzae]